VGILVEMAGAETLGEEILVAAALEMDFGAVWEIMMEVEMEEETGETEEVVVVVAAVVVVEEMAE
jgi:hypothetical protein